MGMEKKRKKLETTWTQENKFHFSIFEKNSKQQNLSHATRKVLVSDFKSEETFTSIAVQER